MSGSRVGFNFCTFNSVIFQGLLRSVNVAKRSATLSRRNERNSFVSSDANFDLPAPPEGFDTAAAAAASETIKLVPQSTAAPIFRGADD
jgi:hypothetical protein